MAGCIAVGPGVKCDRDNVLVLAVGDDVYFEADFSGDRAKVRFKWCGEEPVPEKITPDMVYDALEQFVVNARQFEVISEVQEDDAFSVDADAWTVARRP